MLSITTKSPYALQALCELGQAGAGPVPIGELAKRRGIPTQFLEQLFATLRRAGLLKSQRGVKGGYSLARRPEDVTVVAVIDALEGPIALTECGAGSCEREASCVVRAPWQRINRVVRQSLADVRLADLITPPPFPSQSSQEPLNAQ